MINSFLVTLHNSGTQPTNPASVMGDVLWPPTYLPKVYTGSELLANNILFGRETDPLNHFLVSIQLLWVVEESTQAPYIIADDPRISYTKEQLLGQFESVAGYDFQQITRVLDAFDTIPALSFLEDDLLLAYRSSLSKMDRLAAIIAHFGKRDG